MSLENVPVLNLCIFLCIRYVQLCRLRFLSCILSFFNLVSGFLKGPNLSSIIRSHILHYLFLHLVTPCGVFFSNVEEVNILFRFWGLSLDFNDFVSSISLILSLFSISSRFFIISVNSSGLFLLSVMKYCYILTFDPAQKCYSKVMHRKEVTHSNGQ